MGAAVAIDLLVSSSAACKLQLQATGAVGNLGAAWTRGRGYVEVTTYFILLCEPSLGCIELLGSTGPCVPVASVVW
eukprot:CAMPEP_0174352294 /NCGR_PEP_ID=MMETSP0811_2-20130205/9913_1 /TAXON_ID=73025 ORGANISM="Eutreptiella gymnastica-like, Strain CCMP1594" /NCGR_SAMPLE_ID=MMETSP0811_2 /ASSEMBLY_ACC=CAM_ASM_000667 /LENGTH=75 /DNA_ID=CAMNT_0015482355 /DNA_START=885 /DNA_END=1109 /DNA_ORIENTATION=+